MSMYTCPRCSAPLDYDRFFNSTIVCSCGWVGTRAYLEKNSRKSSLKKVFWVLGLGFGAFLAFQIHQWGTACPERLWYQTLKTLKMTSPQHEARMGYLCRTMGRHSCAVDAYTRAFSLSPKSIELAGSLAIELTEVGKWDLAVLTFQNFFSLNEGQFKHKKYYARALSQAGYVDDATVWFRKALRHQPNNLDVALELVKHLSQHHKYFEAFSVVGYYNLTSPKTQRLWSKTTHEIKEKYSNYKEEYEINEIKISSLNNSMYAPVQFEGRRIPQLFIVNPESDFLTLDLNFLNEQGIPYTSLGWKTVHSTGGQQIRGLRVSLPQLSVGPFTLKKVRGLACENCSFLLGKRIMKRLKFKSKKENGVRYVTLKP